MNSLNRRDFLRALAASVVAAGAPLPLGVEARILGIDMAAGPDETVIGGFAVPEEIARFIERRDFSLISVRRSVEMIRPGTADHTEAIHRCAAARGVELDDDSHGPWPSEWKMWVDSHAGTAAPEPVNLCPAKSLDFDTPP